MKSSHVADGDTCVTSFFGAVDGGETERWLAFRKIFVREPSGTAGDKITNYHNRIMVPGGEDGTICPRSH